MNIQTWLATQTSILEEANINTARLDCLVLLSDVLGKDKAWLLSHAEHELQGSEIKILNNKVVRRAKHIPLAYIRGKAEFYGREFTVNAHTLVPRPETETMIDLLKQLTISDERVMIADIGTGSGAIAITAKLELPNAEVIATDIDQNCLKTAQTNATALGASVDFIQGNLLHPLGNQKSEIGNLILLCNLPYVPDNFQINTAATHEPRHALFGGPDGLDLYRELFTQTSDLLCKPRYILAESLPPQHETLAAIAKAAGYSLQTTNDFIQVFATELR